MKSVYNEILSSSLRFFLKDASVISITGGGGKTSLMVKLANIFSSYGERVLVTTTTKVQSNLVFDGGATCLWNYQNGKCVNPGEAVIKENLVKYDKTIIEADGSRGLPLKFHTQRDPVVIDETDSTLCVVGLSALGKPIKDVLFGYEDLIKETTPLPPICSLSFIEKLIDHPSCVQKDKKGRYSFIVFNQADVVSAEEIEKINAMMFKKELNYMLISIKENKLYAGVKF